jgi:hypothetical protein
MLDLQWERDDLFETLEKDGRNIRSFSVPAYCESLRALQALHERMEGRI